MIRLLKRALGITPQEPNHLVSDLDAITTKSVAFKFGGKVHMIEPLSSMDYFLILEALARVAQVKKSDNIDGEKLVDAFYNVTQYACKSVKKSDIRKMGIHQISALINLIVESVMGKAQVDYPEKKNLIPAT